MGTLTVVYFGACLYKDARRYGFLFRLESCLNYWLLVSATVMMAGCEIVIIRDSPTIEFCIGYLIPMPISFSFMSTSTFTCTLSTLSSVYTLPSGRYEKETRSLWHRYFRFLESTWIVKHTRLLKTQRCSRGRRSVRRDEVDLGQESFCFSLGLNLNLPLSLGWLGRVGSV